MKRMAKSLSEALDGKGSICIISENILWYFEKETNQTEPLLLRYHAKSIGRIIRIDKLDISAKLNEIEETLDIPVIPQ